MSESRPATVRFFNVRVVVRIVVVEIVVPARADPSVLVFDGPAIFGVSRFSFVYKPFWYAFVSRMDTIEIKVVQFIGVLLHEHAAY